MWLQKMIKLDRDWRRSLFSPADRNEYIKLELLRAWEPLDNSRALPFGEKKRNPT